MAVPAHDDRDFAFATKYNLPIERVIEGGDALPYTEYGKMVNSDEFNGLSTEEGKEAIVKNLEAQNLGSGKVNFRLT